MIVFIITLCSFNIYIIFNIKYFLKYLKIFNKKKNNKKEMELM